MNRRMFIAGLLGIPFAAKVVADTVVPASEAWKYNGCCVIQFADSHYRIKFGTHGRFSKWRRYDQPLVRRRLNEFFDCIVES